MAKSNLTVKINADTEGLLKHFEEWYDPTEYENSIEEQLDEFIGHI